MLLCLVMPLFLFTVSSGVQSPYLSLDYEGIEKPEDTGGNLNLKLNYAEDTQPPSEFKPPPSFLSMYYDSLIRLHNIAYEDIYNTKSQYVPVLRGKRKPLFPFEKRMKSNQLPWNIFLSSEERENLYFLLRKE